MKKILLSAALLCLAGTASAQFSWCPTVDTDNYQRFEAGYVNESLSHTSGASVYDGYPGFMFGYLMGLSITDEYPVFIETGARFNWTHSVVDVEALGKTYDDKFTHTWISVPLRLAYKFTINDRFSIQPSAGFNMKFNMIARRKIDDQKINMLDKDDMGGRSKRGKMFQFGGHLGVGFNISQFFLGWEYDGDFSRFVKNEATDDKCKFHTNYVTIGYRFE